MLLFQSQYLFATKQWNWLLDVTLNALMNVLINSPERLNDESMLEIAQKWLKAKDS